MIRTYGLECAAEFIGEKRSQLYEWYCWRVSQAKILLSAKSGFIEQTLPAGRQARFGLERRGA